MNALLEPLARLGDLLLVILGFSSIIVIHELGHFFAARWAGIRVLAFAVGFGPAFFSYRKGLGWRRGSSEPEYKRLSAGGPPPAISSTEYRLNVLPFGGYVKMLGQDDINPNARSSEPDSYQNCKTWKRMVVISAGVIANLITAAILFVGVFMAGLPTEPARVGPVEPGSPAAFAIATNAAQLGISDRGLKSGDEIVAIDGEPPLSFNDLTLASAMARRGRAIDIGVRRAGVDGVINFSVVPVEDPVTKLLYIGIRPASSTRIFEFKKPEEREHFAKILARRGVPGVEAGMHLKSVDGKPVSSLYEFFDVAAQRNGAPVPVVFASDAGKEVAVDIRSTPRMMRDKFMVSANEAREAQHLLGLMPVLAIEDITKGESADKAGLLPGDVFSRIGGVEWPSGPAGIAEIKAHRGRSVPVSVVRRGPDGRWNDVAIGPVAVIDNNGGRIGFSPVDSSNLGSWVGSPTPKFDDRWTPPHLAPGSRIVAVDGHPTQTLLDVRRELLSAAQKLQAAGPGPITVKFDVESPLLAVGAEKRVQSHDWTLSADSVQALAASPWESVLDASMFEPEQIVLQASGPLKAIKMGVRETHRVMMTTYVTLVRLFQGTIKVEHLKGPVGIAHFGTLLAERGFIWLLFFMALISVNLAVINFLPMPVADGGHFLFLLYEQITGKPVSAAIQNIAAIAGLVVLATVFLIVTFHDIKNLLG